MKILIPVRGVVETSTGTCNPTVKPDEAFTYVDVAAVDNQQKVISCAKKVLGVDAPSRARKLLRTNDVLVSTVRPNLNAVALVPPDLDGQVGSTGFCVLRAIRNVILPEYLFFFVRSQRFVEGLINLVSGALYPAVTDSQVLDQQLPLPAIDEQKRIVDLLSRAESIVRLRREAQKKAQAIIPALFLDMFGDPANNPKGWETAYFGEIIKSGPTNGLYKHKSAYGTGTPILRIDAFYNGEVKNLQTLKRVHLEPSEINRFSLSDNDIVINRVNSPEYLGKSALIPPLSEKTVFESNMMCFTVDDSRVLPKFVISLLQTKATRQHFLSNAKHAINQSSINQQDVKKLRVILPPMTAQQAFVRHAEAVKSVQLQQDRAIERAEATFNALLAQMFSEDRRRYATEDVESFRTDCPSSTRNSVST